MFESWRDWSALWSKIGIDRESWLLISCDTHSLFGINSLNDTRFLSFAQGYDFTDGEMLIFFGLRLEIERLKC